MATVSRSPHRSAARTKAEAADTPSRKPRKDGDQPPAERIPWYRTTLAFSLYSAILLATSFPLTLAPLAWLAPSAVGWLPAGWLTQSITLAPLAFVAPVFWIWLVRRPRLTGRRPYLSLLLAGAVFWALTFHYLILPHWAGVFGWLALSTYLSVYIAGFVAITRAAVHRLRVPLILAVPAVWVGLELVRAYMFTGIALAQLGHTQYQATALIQIADAFGAYGVSFVVMLLAACLVDSIPGDGRGWRWWPMPLAVSVLVASFVYGHYRLNEEPPADAKQARVALLQGTVETAFDNMQRERMQYAYNQYGNLARQVHQKYNVDLIIWPESMFVVPDVIDDRPEARHEADESEREAERDPNLLTEFYQYALDVQGINPRGGDTAPCCMLAGGHTVRQITGTRREFFNSALLIDRTGHVADRYYKMHLVIFGEYVPLGNRIPWLYNFSPVGPGLGAGEAPRAFEVSGMRYSPSVCFESIVPHLVNRQVRTLAAEGTPPDVLVNVTNDGWFHGSSCLDQHLACNVFRAIENRRPMLVAANEGLSAHIDARGEIVSTVPRRQPGIVLAKVTSDNRWGLYQQIGDLPAWCLAAFSLLAAVVGLWSWRAERRARRP